MPIPAGELLEGPFGMVGFGDDVVIRSLFAQDFAAGFLGDHLNVLMIDVLASQFFAAVLIGCDAGHDGFGGQDSSAAASAEAAASRNIEIRRSFAMGCLRLFTEFSRSESSV